MKLPARRALITLLLIAGYDHSALGMPSFNQVKADFQPSDTLILDRHGEIIQRLRTDASVRRGQWVALADVSPALVQCEQRALPGCLGLVLLDQRIQDRDIFDSGTSLSVILVPVQFLLQRLDTGQLVQQAVGQCV